MNELPEAVVPGSPRLADHEHEPNEKGDSAPRQQWDASRFRSEERRDNRQEGEKHYPHP
jgi:hypothetical protein